MVRLGDRHVATLMKRMGIEEIYRRPNTSRPTPGHKIYPYLPRGVKVERPNQVWATDMTYIPMARGFVYLVAVVDGITRRVLSHRVSITMDVAFCIEALEALACNAEIVERVCSPRLQGDQSFQQNFRAREIRRCKVMHRVRHQSRNRHIGRLTLP